MYLKNLGLKTFLPILKKREPVFIHVSIAMELAKNPWSRMMKTSARINIVSNIEDI